MNYPDFSRDDFLAAHVDAPNLFPEWAWRAYDGMRRQRDLHRARAVKWNARSTGGKRKCPYCSGRAFRGPVVEKADGKNFLLYACIRCGNEHREPVIQHAGGYVRNTKEPMLDRVRRYVREERKDPAGCRAREVAEALGVDPKGMASWLSLLFLKGEIERPEPGLYK